MPGICPKCKSPVVALRGNAVEVAFTGGNFHAVTYSCLACNTVISAEIDPLALRADIVEMTADAVVKRLRR